MGSADKAERNHSQDLTASGGDKPEATPQGVQSLETGIAVALVLAGARKPLGVSEISALAGLSASTVHRYLTSLTRTGVAEQLGFNGKYELGATALYLGLQAIGKLDSQRHLTTAVEALAESTELTAQGAVWSRNGPTIVQWKNSSREVVVSARLGSTLPMLSSAAGLVFAAYLPRDYYKTLVESELKAPVPPTNFGKPLTADAVASLLKDVREQGLAVIQGDLVAGIDALSAPVFDARGELAFTLSVMGARGTVDLSPSGSHAQEVRGAASSLSHRLGAEGASARAKGSPAA